MNAKIVVVLAIIAAFTCLQSAVKAQSSSAASISNSKNYLLKGDSLLRINNRTAQNDFRRFFEQTNSDSNSNNSDGKKRTAEELNFQKSLSLPNNSILLQPAQSSNGNDGVQVQLDFVNTTKQ